MVTCQRGPAHRGLQRATERLLRCPHASARERGPLACAPMGCKPRGPDPGGPASVRCGTELWLHSEAKSQEAKNGKRGSRNASPSTSPHAAHRTEQTPNRRQSAVTSQRLLDRVEDYIPTAPNHHAAQNHHPGDVPPRRRAGGPVRAAAPGQAPSRGNAGGHTRPHATSAPSTPAP